jgi:hypothetical protein
VQNLKHCADFLAFQRIIDGLGIAPGVDQVGVAQLAQMVRHGRLRQPRHVGQLQNALLAVEQNAQNTQPNGLRQHLHQFGRFTHPRLHFKHVLGVKHLRHPV